MPGKQGKTRDRYQDRELDRAVTAYARRMRETRDTFAHPTEGYCEPVEYKGGGEAQQYHFEMFWSRQFWKYDRERFQLPRDRSPTRRAVGNFLRCGVFAWSRDRREMFSTERIYSPLDATLTRAQWVRLIRAGLFKREAHWVWLPAVARAAKASGDAVTWDRYHVYGWSIHNERIGRWQDIEECAVVIDTTKAAGPEGKVINAREYFRNLPIWKGQSLYADITTSIFARPRE